MLFLQGNNDDRTLIEMGVGSNPWSNTDQRRRNPSLYDVTHSFPSKNELSFCAHFLRDTVLLTFTCLTLPDGRVEMPMEDDFHEKLNVLLAKGAVIKSVHIPFNAQVSTG